MLTQLEQWSLPVTNVQAFTWNGFEDGTTFMGGLWSGRNTQQADFATVVYRAQLAGFNAVRLPFRSVAPLLRRVICGLCMPRVFEVIREFISGPPCSAGRLAFR